MPQSLQLPLAHSTGACIAFFLQAAFQGDLSAPGASGSPEEPPAGVLDQILEGEVGRDNSPQLASISDTHGSLLSMV